MPYQLQGSFNKQIWDFDPRTIPACVLWLDASDASSIRLSGSNVTAWIDKSTAPTKLGGTTGIGVNSNSVSPTIATAALNGRNTIAFLGSSNQGLSTGTGLATVPTGSASGTYFVVSRATTTGANPQIMFAYGASTQASFNNRQFYFSSTAGTAGPNIITDLVQTATRVVATNQYSSQSYTMISSNQTLSGSTLTNTSFVNGAAFATNNNFGTTSAAVGTSIFSVGCAPVGGSTIGGYLTGNVAEILIFSTVLSTTERQQVEGYLAWKWGLYDLLVAGHPYKPFNSPSNVSNPFLWFDAADSNSVVVAPTTSGRWKDKSGNGRDFGRLGPSGPDYGSNAVTFDRTARACMRSVIPVPWTANTTNLFVVANLTSSANFNYLIVFGTGGTDFSLRYVLGNSINSNDVFFSTTTANIVQFFNGASNSASTTASIPLVGATSRFLVDGVVQTGSSSTTSIQLSNNVDISGGSRNFGGDINEVIMCGTLTSAQRLEVQGYLAWKWGLQTLLPATHAYAPFTPTPLSSIDPRNIPGLALWLDAADATTLFSNTAGTQLVTTNGDIVRRINDKSGNFRNATASATTNLYRTSQLNGNSGIQVPSPNSGFATPSFILSPTNTCTLFIVALQISSDNASLVQSTIQTTMRIQLEATFARLNLNNTSLNSSLMVNRLGFPNIYSIAFDSTTLTGFFNGTSAGTGSGTSDGSLSSSTIYTFATNNGMNGYLYEAILYNRNLTVTQRQEVEGYLAHKWGLQANLPSSHPYASPIYTLNEIVPSIFPDLALWLDAADATTLSFSSGTNVSQWRDKSGNGRDMSPTANAFQYVSEFNGSYPTLSSDIAGGNGQIGTISSFTLPNPSTVFAVIQNRAVMDTGTPRFPYIFNVGSGVNRTYAYCRNQAVNPGRLRVSSGNNSDSETTPALMLTTAQVFTMDMGATNTLSYTNGNLISTSGITGATVTAGFTTIGGNGTSSQWTGHFCEFMIFNTALTTTQRQQIEAYLANKWGLQANLPSTHPYAPTKFTNGPVGFTPTTLSPSLWLDAADATTIDPPVTQWNDKSGNGYNLTTTLGPTRSFTTNNPTGVDLMFASSSSNFLSRTGISVNSPTFTYFTVIKDLGDTTSYGRFVSAGTTQDQGTLDNTGFSISHDIGNAQGIITKQQGAASPYTQLNVFTGITSPASTYALVSFTSGSTFAGFLNGTQLSAPAITSPLYAFTQFSIGRFLSGGSALTGIVNEAIAFTSALTTTQRQQVEGYLAWKWGLQTSLPSTHPYYRNRDPIVRPFLRTFVPTDVSVPCLLWFDGQDPSTVTGTSPVTRWNDKSGNANSISTFSGSPSYDPSTGFVTVTTNSNVANAITFSSTTQYSVFTALRFPPMTDNGFSAYIQPVTLNPSFVRISRFPYSGIITNAQISGSNTIYTFQTAPANCGAGKTITIQGITLAGGATLWNGTGTIQSVSGTIPNLLITVNIASTGSPPTSYTGATGFNGTDGASYYHEVSGGPYNFFGSNRGSNRFLGTKFVTGLSLPGAGLTATVSLNGVTATQAQSGSSTLASLTQTPGIGSLSGSAGSYGIGEILIYNGTLSTQERQDVEGYLMWKWGIQRTVVEDTGFPTTHPFYQFPTATTTPFDPRIFGNLYVWYDGADSTTLSFSSGSNVNAWRDKSGNGNNLTGSATRTAVTTNPVGVDITFNGNPDSLSTTSLAVPINSTSFTYFTVIMNNDLSTGYGRFASAGTTSDNLAGDTSGFFISNDGGATVAPFKTYLGKGSIVTRPNLTKGAYHILCIVFTSAPLAIAFHDGVSVGAFTPASNVFNFTKFSFGKTIVGGNPLVGVINESIAFTTAFTTSQRQQVEGYLAWKWGLQANLPSTHPYSKVSY